MSIDKKLRRLELIKKLPTSMTVSAVESCIDIYCDIDEKEIDNYRVSIKKAWLIGRDIELTHME